MLGADERGGHARHRDTHPGTHTEIRTPDTFHPGGAAGASDANRLVSRTLVIIRASMSESTPEAHSSQEGEEEGEDGGERGGWGGRWK